VPRTVDGSELAVRAVLGQQVSTAAARTSAAALVVRHGQPVADPAGSLTHLFPSPEQLVGAEPALAGGRGRTVAVLVDALVSGHLDLGPGSDRAEARRVLAALPGFGAWTVELVAMRALGDPDAFPGGDLGVRRAAAGLGLPTTPAGLHSRSERWRPWRAYAVQYLWSTADHPINTWPPTAGLTAPRHPRATKEPVHA
jgi:AraC family transcriptional regulator of adaptative response / DNA-3-methyladenine glycosylase II